MADGAGAGLMQQSGQDLASQKCFLYIYCDRGEESWLCRTYRAHSVEEDTLLEVTDLKEGTTDNTMARRTTLPGACSAIHYKIVHLVV